jgi:hypothetical protein
MLRSTTITLHFTIFLRVQHFTNPEDDESGNEVARTGTDETEDAELARSMSLRGGVHLV